MKVKFPYNGKTVVMNVVDGLVKKDRRSRRLMKKYGKVGPKDSFSTRIFHKKMFHNLEWLERTREFVGENSVVLDCGTFIGNHSVFWGMCGSRVMAFEGHEKNFAILQQNIIDNNLSNLVFAHNYLLSDQPGRFRCDYVKELSASTRFVKDPSGKYSSTSIDKWREEQNHISTVDVMKINVEGCEHLLLKGSEQTLAKYHPIVLLEIHFGDDPRMDKKCLSLLNGLGYNENVDVFIDRRKK